MYCWSARELLERAHQDKASLDAFTLYILQWVTLLDDLGAQNWNLRIVGLCSFIVLFVIRAVTRYHNSIKAVRTPTEWYSILNSTVVGTCSLLCVYLDLVAAPRLFGTDEPRRLCESLTSLHRILPAITMG